MARCSRCREDGIDCIVIATGRKDLRDRCSQKNVCTFCRSAVPSESRQAPLYRYQLSPSWLPSTSAELSRDPRLRQPRLYSAEIYSGLHRPDLEPNCENL